ncbi:MAG: DNA methyltransferase [Gammaproteobacteria bacterium]
MLTKEKIESCKRQGNGALINLVAANADGKSTLFILQRLGRLPEDFDDSWVTPLLVNGNHKIRLWSAKTLGKVGRAQNIATLRKSATEDESTEVRREAVASIGRIRSEAAIPALTEFLADDDPKVVLQAIRGLLVFKKDARICRKLKTLRRHPNEMIQSVLQKEFSSDDAGCAFDPEHARSHDFLKNVIVLGDVRKVLNEVPDESFHLTFTSPPYYNARDYSIYKSYREYLDFLEQVFALTHAKTKEGRFLIVNTSPIIIPRISRQHSSKRYPIPFDIHGFLVKMGWEFIDDIVWEKPETSVKNRTAGFLQHRKPLAYKPNAVTEYLMVYRKKTDKLIDWNIRQYDRKTVNQSKVHGEYDTSNVWKIDPAHNRVHSAVFPAELCSRVARYYSFKNDLVFDPFAGSGTFGRVAKKVGRFFFLTEKSPKYFEYMQSFTPGNLFEEPECKSNFLTLAEFKKTAKGAQR